MNQKNKKALNIPNREKIKKSYEKKAWETDQRFGEDAYTGIRSSDRTEFTDNRLRNLDFEENTKFYHKEIAIKPVSTTKKKKYD